MHKLPTINRMISYGVVVTGVTGAIASGFLAWTVGARSVLIFTALAAASAGYGLEIIRRSRRAPAVSLEPVRRLGQTTA